MEEQLKKKTEENIKQILDEGINQNNLELLYKLTKINHIVKEDENMNYGNYGNYGGRRAGYDSYGEYRNYGRESYGRRGVDDRYRGDDYLDRMSGEYGRYQQSRGRYGEDSDKSFYYMVEALKDFIKVLNEEAETQQQKQMLRESLQNAMM